MVNTRHLHPFILFRRLRRELRWFLHIEVPHEHLTSYWRGRDPTVAAILDKSDHYYLRVFRRSVTREPRVILYRHTRLAR
jgi:hypothetical protein